jgi:hypothetical protein
MAINDDLRTRNRMTDAREGMGMVPIVVLVLLAIAVGWWVFGDRMAASPDGATRTTVPVTGSPSTGTNTTSNPTTTPKQP